MNLITLDYETYYDQQYSLSKLTNEEYIRDPRFECIGFSIKINSGKSVWFSDTHKHLRDILLEHELHKHAVLSHHAHFDMAILNWIFGIRPKVILDTLSMARAVYGASAGNNLAKLAERLGLGAKGDEVIKALGKRRLDFTAEELYKYGQYCRNDVDITYAAFLKLKSHINNNELKIIDQTVRMFTEPALRVDVPLLEEHLTKVKQRKNSLLESCGVDKKDLMSNEKFASLLRGLGVEPPIKVSATTGKEAYAFAKTDEGFKALLEHEDERVQALAAARVGNKSTLEETRTQRFIDIGRRGLIPVPLNYCGAHTSRWSGAQNLNFQNLPSRGKGTNTIKRALMAPLGHVIIEADSAQIEARILAWFAGQQDLVDDFAAGRDIYKKMAAAIYKKSIDEIGKPSKERDIGKATVLGAGFGMGGERFQVELKKQNIVVERYESDEMINIYRQTYPLIPTLWEEAGYALQAILRGQSYRLPNDCVQVIKGGLLLPNGLKIRYDNLRYEHDDRGKKQMVYDQGKKPTKIYGAKAVENCIAENTLVLTNNGWKPIQYVSKYDLVHDGVEFVQHGGIVSKSAQPCVTIDGVHMTEDHEVLTDEGWKCASQQPRPYRPKIWGDDCTESVPHRWKEVVLAFSMPMWECSGETGAFGSAGSETWWNPQLWLSYKTADIYEEQDAWYEQTPSVRCMEEYAGSVSATDSPSLEKLWGPWYKCMSALAGVFYQFLGRYGEYLSEGIRFRSYRQRWELHSGELSMDYQAKEYHEQTNYRTPSRCSDTEPTDWDKSVNAILPLDTWLECGKPDQETKPIKPVYDIVNCGPRHRFVVLGAGGPFIVHNCIQALASCIIREQALLISKRYKWALTVHDSLVVVVREEEKEEAMDYVVQCMRYVPDWAEGVPLDCEAGYAERYGDC